MTLAGLVLSLTACAPVQTANYANGSCTVVAVDMRSGTNILTRSLAQPHRFLEVAKACNLSVEDSNPSALDGLLGPLGEGAADHVVIPVR